GEELDLVARYLHIEHLRLGDRLKVEMDVADLPRDLAIPRLLLQPLVENAVYHGIQPLADGGTVSVSGRRVPGAVEIVVRNPLSSDAPTHRNGVALANIRARIEYHFGARGELRVEPGPEAYVVNVRLPETRT
ncbi:MAG: sensor histidine kinase, partial [Dokdonella sp.]